MTTGTKGVPPTANVAALKTNVTGPPRDNADLHDRRLEERYPTCDTAEVQVLPIDGTRRPATVLNVSRSALRLELHTPVAKGMDIKVILSGQVVIFGEVRYCKRAGDAFHAAVLIHDIIHSRQPIGKHVDDDDLSLYLVGKGLNAPEVIKLREHLVLCESCRIRLDEVNVKLNPATRNVARKKR